MWGATRVQGPVAGIQGDFNPRSPCGERPEYKDPSLESKVISIHAPRVGSDLRRYHLHHPRCGFQSTLPVWGATRPAVEKLAEMEFQSTLPVWGATGHNSAIKTCIRNFNPRSPCGERLCLVFFSRIPGYFNPRSPCGERLLARRTRRRTEDFNPRSPCGERQAPPRRFSHSM